MTIAETIRAKLIANPALSALVGARIYPLKLPQNPTYPAITYQRVAGDYQGDIGVHSPDFQFDCWASGYTEAENLTRALINALDRESWRTGNHEIIKCTLNRTPLDLYDSVVNKHRVSLDFSILYREV